MSGFSSMPDNKALKKRRIHNIISLSVIIFTIIISVRVYNNLSDSLKNDLNAGNLSMLNDLSDHVYDQILSDLNYYDSEIASVASSFNYIPSQEDRIRYLEECSLKMNSLFGIINFEGKLTIINSDSSVNIRNTGFYTKAMNGLSYAGLLYTDVDIQGSNRFIMFSSPISNIGSDIPSGAVCKIMKPELLMTSITLNPNLYQLVLCDSDNKVITFTKNPHRQNSMSIPLKELIENQAESLQFTPTSNNESTLLYETNENDQYIKKTTKFFKDWIIYTSINNESFKVDMSDYRIHFILFTALFIMILILEVSILIIPTMRDKTEKRVEQTRGTFIASMSHELRTPLNTIIGISEILSRSELTAGQIREVMYITDAGKHLLAMINDILDYSKLQSDRFELVTEKYDLESLIYDITTVATVRLDNKPVEFIVKISPYVPRYVIGDMTRVRQILNNIISNAVKYTQKGSITLTIDCINDSENVLQLLFRITDTGIGIKKENIGKLFDQYTRFDSNLNKNVEGTGLGLGIAKQFAILMGGDILVSSEYGKGSEFTIIIKQQSDDSSESESLLPEYKSPSENDNIIILEKSSLLRDYYSSCLDEMFINYMITDDNFEFSNLLGENHYKYIIADSNTIQMLSEEMGDNKDTTLISLVHNSAETINVKNTILVPLFPIQLCTYLTGRRQPLHRNASWNSYIIYPMPEKNILIVDDNNMNLQVTMGILEPYKMNIDLADSGEKALDMAGKKHYDLIFMDHMMPGMDGEETMNAIRDNYPAYKTIPVVALTANAATGARKMFTDMGFDDFIPKPLETGVLHELLYKWLKPANTENAIEFSPVTPELDHEYDDKSIINFNEGLERIGSMPIYLKTLRNFCNTIPEKADILQRTFPDDMKTFVIEVHGLKGLAAIVSANDLTTRSLELEMMGKSDNVEGIRPLLPDYYEYLKEVKLCAERFIEEYT